MKSMPAGYGGTAQEGSPVVISAVEGYLSKWSTCCCPLSSLRPRSWWQAWWWWLFTAEGLYLATASDSSTHDQMVDEEWAALVTFTYWFTHSTNPFGNSPFPWLCVFTWREAELTLMTSLYSSLSISLPHPEGKRGVLSNKTVWEPKFWHSVQSLVLSFGIHLPAGSTPSTPIQMPRYSNTCSGPEPPRIDWLSL